MVNAVSTGACKIDLSQTNLYTRQLYLIYEILHELEVQVNGLPDVVNPLGEPIKDRKQVINGLLSQAQRATRNLGLWVQAEALM